MATSFVVGLLAIAAIVTVVMALITRRAPETTATSDQISALVRQLRATGKDASFAVLIFLPPGVPDDDMDRALNLQYSIENDRVGLDWVLLGSPNIADKTAVLRFAQDNGYAAVEHEMNGVRYLRIEEGDIAALGLRIICDLYHVPADKKLGLIVEGFVWDGAQEATR